MAQIVWHGNAFDSTGYAKATRQYVTALHARGADVKLVSHSALPPIELPQEQRLILEHLQAKPPQPDNGSIFITIFQSYGGEEFVPLSDLPIGKPRKYRTLGFGRRIK